jgi:hypothetical protein
MTKTAFKKNPALIPLSGLIGSWNVTMNHVALPEPVTWKASVEWFENAFIIMRWLVEKDIPDTVMIMGRNENKPNDMYSLLTYDSRGVSRTFDMGFSKGVWKFSREDPDFFQRFEGIVNKDSITGKGENSYDSGKTWEHDFDMTYTRIK